MTGGAVGVWYMALFAKQGFVYELYGEAQCCLAPCCRGPASLIPQGSEWHQKRCLAGICVICLATSMAQGLGSHITALSMAMHAGDTLPNGNPRKYGWFMGDDATLLGARALPGTRQIMQPLLPL